MVSGLSACALSAQALSMDMPAVVATAAAGGTAAAVLRKLRRSILLRRSTSLMRSSLMLVTLRRSAAAESRRRTALASFLLLEKRDDGFSNRCVLLFVEHDGAGNERLGIGQIGIEVLLVPHEIGSRIARRIAKAGKPPGFAAVNARQYGSLARRVTRVQRVTGGALLLEEICPGRRDWSW